MDSLQQMLTQFEIEQFYYQEAELLDERKYITWLALLSEDIQYVMCNRFNPQRDISKRDTEEYSSVDYELSGTDEKGLPIREENLFILSLRAQRAYKFNAWGDNPPMLTRRVISNVRYAMTDSGGYDVKSYFHFAMSRWGNEPQIVTGYRHDHLLKSEDQGFKIVQREVVLDQTITHLPTLGILI